MAVNYTPNYESINGNFKTLKPFRFWCQKVLPLVYDDSLSYYELLNKVVDYLNNTMEDVELLNGNVNTLDENVRNIFDAYNELQSYVNNYFDNLDVQEEINNKLNVMAVDGTLSNLINTIAVPLIPGLVEDWLEENIEPTTPIVDATLSISGAAADAKVTGDKVTELKNAINPLYAVIAPQIIANSYWPYEGSSAGIPSYYSGWSRTDRLPCVEGETLKITATVASVYNVFFNTDTDSDVNGHFNIAVGENSILVPQGAHYYALSNTTSGMINTTIKKIIDGTTVNNGIDTIEEIDNALNGIRTPISYESPTSGGYYYATAGKAITIVEGTGNYFSEIDLSSYAGKKVRISFVSNAMTSTRATAICDSNGIVGGFVEENTIIANGYAEFDIGLTYNRLYISYNASAYNLTITVIDVGVIYELEEIPSQCVYVSENGNDSNNGSITAPFATLQQAVDSGALIIKVEAGEYKGVTIKDRIAPLKIMLKNMPNEYIAQTPEAPKIKITTNDTSDYYGIYAVNCSDIYLSDIWVDGTAYDSYYLTNVEKLECIRCWCCDTTDSNSMGFRLTNVNGVFRDCKAWNVSKDGFNIHLYGDTQFINCEAHDCGDDGISHHEGCNGMILGGEYYNNVKGGIASPYGGCNVNIYNTYLHNNRFGIYSQSGEEHNKSKGIVSNCVIKNNTEYDINIAKSDIIGWNNIYDTKTVDSTGSFTEF